MSTFVPDAATLLQAAADYLEAELLPTLAGYHRFQTRITVNVLRTVTRELQLAPAQQEAQRERLAALLGTGHDGDAMALEAELAAAIVDGRQPIDDAALIDHLRRTLREALAIDNPKWASAEAPTSDKPQGARA
ncbi:MAG: DUF6285 domain-containing protein [Rubrivivax sp.]